MTGRAAAAALALVVGLAGLAGCVSFGGRSRAFDSTRLTTDPGWIAAVPTPAVRQEGSQDCGAASLAMVAARWRVDLSLEEAVAALPDGATRGARLGDLRDVARAHRLRAFAIAGDRDTLVHELRAGRPVILGLLLRHGPRRALSHYEVIVAVHAVDGRFVTIDPATGSRVRSWADLDAEWLPAGRPTLVVVGAAEP